MDWITRLMTAIRTRLGMSSVSTPYQLGYEAGAKSIYRDDWQTSIEGPEAIGRDLPAVRARSRDAEQNDEHGVAAFDRLESSIVGVGINPRARHKDKRGATDAEKQRNRDSEDKINDLWKEWQRTCLTGSRMGWAGFVSLAVRGTLVGGDVLVRKRVRRTSDGFAVPMQLQVLEAEFLDSNRETPSRAGGRVVDGVEFDQIGNIRGYWVYRSHPHNYDTRSAISTLEGSVFVRESEMVHLFFSRRPGQVRGVPWAHAALTSLRDFSDWFRTNDIRSKVEGAAVGVVTSHAPGQALPGAQATTETGAPLTTADGKTPVTDMRPGQWVIAKNGHSVEFLRPTPQSGLEEGSRVRARRVGAGVGVPYAIMTGDVSDTNYSSMRAVNEMFYGQAEELRAKHILPILCERVWRWWIDLAVLSGQLEPWEAGCDVHWSAPPMPVLNPVARSQADRDDLRSGLRSYADVIASRGGDPDKVLAETRRFNELLDEFDIRLDSDGRVEWRKGRKPVDDESDAGEAGEGSTEPSA